MDKFYQLKTENGSNELLIYGDIKSYKWYEDDVCAYDMAKELDTIEGDLTVRINSYGGEVSQGLAIYNLLKNYSGIVKTVCDGFACSAASVIFMAGKSRIMPKSSLLLIHNAWTWTSGDANALRKEADDLEKITLPSVEIYKANSNLSEDEIKAMMDDETWITAEEALQYGFATEVPEEEAQQSLDKRYMSKLVHENKRLQKMSKEKKEDKKDAWTSFFKGGK